MNKWLKFFFGSFFSDKLSKEGVKRSYSNFFLGFLLALSFLWLGLVGGDMLPFTSQYNNAPDLKSTVRAVLANPDINKRIIIEVENNAIKAKKQGGEFEQALLINTIESNADERNYSLNGFDVVVDMRPADTLAAFEAYALSNDGNNTRITYEQYLELSEVARLNFDFKLKYTGQALVLDAATVEAYRAYVNGLSEDNRLAVEDLDKKLNENTITKTQYDRAIYELYFVNYYPAITDYEGTSKVPLLRNYYYHEYLIQGINNYVFIFDDYVAGSFTTKQGISRTFYGFYNKLNKGVLIKDSLTQAQANLVADSFIKQAFKSLTGVNVYAYAMNVISLVPFIALMPMVVTLLAYSILKLKGVQSVTTLGAAFKIVGAYVWASGLIAALLTIVLAFFVKQSLLSMLPLVIFFVILAVRSMIFAINQVRADRKQAAQKENNQAEV